MNNNDNNYIEALILKFACGGTLSEEEQLDLNRWRSRSPDHQEVPDLFANSDWVNDQLQIVREFPKEKVWQHLMERVALGDAATGAIPFWRRLITKKALAAAGIIGIIVAARYLYLNSKHGMDKKNYYALLTMPVNNRILLDTAKPGRLNTSPAASKLQNDTLDYEHETSRTPETAVYHQITVDTGTTMRIHLPDGTWVSLSNASTIKYPVTNTGAPRECFLEGRAGFEVTHDPNRPFIVHMDSTTVEVLGTSFNISAYKNDSVAEITLNNGSVRVTHGAHAVTLDGTRLRQARITGGRIEAVPLSDSAVETIMSWQDKTPRLRFDNTDLKDALHMISLRYGVAIRYEDSVRSVRITGTILLKYTLDETIRIINSAVKKIHVGREGNSLIVSAK